MGGGGWFGGRGRGSLTGSGRELLAWVGAGGEELHLLQAGEDCPLVRWLPKAGSSTLATLPLCAGPSIPAAALASKADCSPMLWLIRLPLPFLSHPRPIPSPPTPRSRYLANKCSIASRIDCFMDTATDAFGQKLREQVRFPPLFPLSVAGKGRTGGGREEHWLRGVCPCTAGPCQHYILPLPAFLAIAQGIKTLNGSKRWTCLCRCHTGGGAAAVLRGGRGAAQEPGRDA